MEIILISIKNISFHFLVHFSNDRICSATQKKGSLLLNSDITDYWPCDSKPGSDISPLRWNPGTILKTPRKKAFPYLVQEQISDSTSLKNTARVINISGCITFA